MKKVSIYKAEGIIIRAADLGELDRLLFLYTRGYGKISVRAISARKNESKLRGRLEPFTRGQFLLAKSKTIDIVTDFEIIDNFSYLHKNIESLAYAYYFSELIDKLVTGQEADDNLWRLIKRAFEVCNQKRDDLPKIKEMFEDKLIEFLGHPSQKLWMTNLLPLKFLKKEEVLPLTRLSYLQSLAGEQINSHKFLTQI